MKDTRNTILAVVLSGLVLLVWQYFYVVPTEKRREQTAQTQVVNPPGQTNTAAPAAGSAPAAGGSAPPAPQAAPNSATPAQATTTPQSRATALAASPRVKIDTPAVSVSIALKGARIDDLTPKQSRA